MFPKRTFLAYFFAMFLLALANWLGISFGDPTIDQILYHLHYNARLGIEVGRIFLFTFIVECMVIPLVAALGAVALQLLVQELLSRMRRHRVRLAMGAVLPAAAVACGVAALAFKLSLYSWVSYKFEPDQFGARYADPARVVLKTVKPRNLVLLYVESLEATYGRQELWGRDLLEPLRKAGGVSFSNYLQAPGANWTIAAMVATQCGVPLRYATPSSMHEAGPAVPVFLPRAKCLSDILHEKGYVNVFLGGAPLTFAGKGQFLRDHKYDQLFGRHVWEAQGAPAEAFGEWGMFDDALFERAKVQLTKLHDSGKHFNLTLLTLDTHNPNGFQSPYCRRRGLRDFRDIVECTSEQVADFLEFIESSGYLRDTQVVVIGDHLSVSNPLEDKLREVGDRRIFNRLISSSPIVKNTETLVAFDFFPSILEFIGFEVVGDRLGLGYSALNTIDVPRPPDRLDAHALSGLSASATYDGLWEPR